MGRRHLKKNGKIWEKFPIRLDPPPSDNSEYFEFQKLLKQAVAELGQTQVKLEDVDEVVVEARS